MDKCTSKSGKHEFFATVCKHCRYIATWKEMDKALNAQPDAGWISVEDAFPNNAQDVWAYNGEQYRARYFVDSGRFLWHPNRGNGASILNVTHWQPLPKPPEVE